MNIYKNNQLALIYGGKKKKPACSLSQATHAAESGAFWGLVGFSPAGAVGGAIWEGGTCLASNLPN